MWRQEKNRVAAAVGEQEEGRTELHTVTSFYLAEYDVDYTADHHQGIEDIPGVPDIALCGNMHSQQEERGGQERRGMQGGIKGREVRVSSNGDDEEKMEVTASGRREPAVWGQV